MTQQLTSSAYLERKRKNQQRQAALEAGLQWVPGSPDSSTQDDIFQLQHQHLLSCLENTTVSARNSHYNCCVEQIHVYARLRSSFTNCKGTQIEIYVFLKICMNRTGLTFLSGCSTSKLAVTVHRCLRSRALTYLADHCIPISEVAGRQHPRPARCQQMNVPRVRRIIGRRAFASAGPTVWNSLPDNLRDSTVGPDHF